MVNFSTILVHVQVWSQIKYMHIHGRHLQILDIRECKWEKNKVIHPHVFFSKENNKKTFKYILFCAVCRKGSYGINCNETCGQCRDIIQCSHINGTCLTGCESGFRGDLCKTGAYIFRYDKEKSWSILKRIKNVFFLFHINKAIQMQ